MAKYRYAGYPSAKVHETKGGKKQIHHLLWGDWVRLEGEEEDGWAPVRVRGVDGWMKTEDLQQERLLEIVFVDVGQGDGCLLVTPRDKHHVIDAGVGDNMYRFLRWRYGGFKKKWRFESAIITHPDADHYEGFRALFEEKNVFFDTVYHNGILEWRGDDPLGKRRDGYLVEIIEDRRQLAAFLDETDNWMPPGKPRYAKRFPSLLHAAHTGGRVDDIRSLSDRHSEGGFLPGYGPGNELSIQVLGPVVEPDSNGRSRLRTFGDQPGSRNFNKGKTKNGHSVILRLRYRDVSVLFGGDLNSPAETFLLEHYTGLPAPAASASEERRLIDAAAAVFGVDIAKSCHHGSADFTDAFLRATHAAATVISSGDEESHAHPRCDTLGAIGLAGRGWRPLIFSTELARSTREDEGAHRERIGELREMLKAATGAELEDLKKEHDGIVDELLKRNVTSYGAINLRTDGRKAVMAYMRERPALYGSSLSKWDIYRLERAGEGPLDFVP